jgi:FkbM family methyltransferase
MIELLGRLIKASGTRTFRGKSRLIHYWLRRRIQTEQRVRELPGGSRIACDMAVPYEAMVWLRQEEERDLVVLEGLLRRGDNFVDCGANIGLWTLAAVPRVRPEGTVYAFEPNPNTFGKLSRNVKVLNDFDSAVRLSQSAVSNRAGDLDFLSSVAHNISSVVAEASRETTRVPAVALDTALAGVAVQGIKIDVEGYELNVLQGAAGLLGRYHPWLCIEFNTELAKVNKLSDWDVHKFLREIGYRPCLFSQSEIDSCVYLSDDWQTTGYLNLYYSMVPPC